MVKKAQRNESDKAKKVKDIREEVPTVLSLLEHEAVVMSDVQKEVLQDEVSELPAIKEGDINVSGVYAYDLEDKIEVKIYIRNGLSQNVNFDYIPFIIVNSKGDVLAYQMFNLKELGDIPPHSARPWKLYFDKVNVYSKIPMDDWKISFDSGLKVEEFIDVEYENLPEGIGAQEKSVFDKFLMELTKLKTGEFSVSTFSLGIQKDGNMLVTLLMRNGSAKPIKIDKIPVTVKDTKGNVIKSNLFELDEFIVSPFKAKICNFAFPTTLKLEEDVALNEWNVSFKLEEPVKGPETEEASLEQ